MPRILLIAATTGYQTRAFAEAAQRLGCDVTLATDRCHVLEDPWGDNAIPLRFDDPVSAAATLGQLWPRPNGIIAPADQPAYIAALAAQALGLPFNPPEAVALARSKFKARQKFRSAGLLVPEFYRLRLDTDPELPSRHAPYPCVLKPQGLSGSRGVIRANNPDEFLQAFRRIRALLALPDIARLRDEDNRWLLVESYISGQEFALEGIANGGRLRTLAIFDKPDPLEGPFFEETIYVTPSRAPLDVQSDLENTTQRAIDALGLWRGPIHAELRHNEDGPWILEVAARPIGGLCAQSLSFNGGMSLEELLLRHALGEDVGGIQRESAASGVMMIPIPKSGIYAGVKGVDEARAVCNVTDVVITAKEGQKLIQLPEGASYLGFIFARAENPSAVEKSLREAHSRLRIEIATELDVI